MLTVQFYLPRTAENPTKKVLNAVAKVFPMGFAVSPTALVKGSKVAKVWSFDGKVEGSNTATLRNETRNSVAAMLKTLGQKAEQLCLFRNPWKFPVKPGATYELDTKAEKDGAKAKKSASKKTADEDALADIF